MSVQILKLTPPQIAALRETFPFSVDAGILTTTASIATFQQVQNTAAGIAPTPGVPWTKASVRSVIAQAASGARGVKLKARALWAVVDKLDTRPDLVRES